MPKSLSFDLRSRVLAAIDEGFSCRQAAARFGVSASSAIRWQALRRAGGDGRPKPQGGDRLSRRTEQHGNLIRALLIEASDITLALTPKTKEALEIGRILADDPTFKGKLALCLRARTAFNSFPT